MKAPAHLLLSAVAIVALGSAMAVAQTAPPEVTEAPAAAPSSGPQPPGPAPTYGGQEIQAGNETNDIEDAPVEVEAQPTTDWAPDINLDAIREAREERKIARVPGRAVRRKVLSDAGDGTLETSNWSNADADAQLLSRSQRRARPVDPAKRADLTGLSRVMGALHALRVSCAGRDDQTYRSRMATLLDLEAPPSGDLRDPLVDAFNGGFQTHGRGAGACPADARNQEANLAKDGLALARKLASQYRPAPKVVASVLPPANQPRQNVAIAPAPPAPPAAPPPSKSASWNSAN